MAVVTAVVTAMAALAERDLAAASGGAATEAAARVDGAEEREEMAGPSGTAGTAGSVEKQQAGWGRAEPMAKKG